MKPLRVIVLILAILHALAFITGISGISGSFGEPVTISRIAWPERLLLLGLAVFYLTWYFALRNRHILGWYLGCVFCVLLPVSFLEEVIFKALIPFYSSGTEFEPFGWFVVQVAACIVVPILAWLVFKKWWLPKKPQFTANKPNNAPQATPQSH